MKNKICSTYVGRKQLITYYYVWVELYSIYSRCNKYRRISFFIMIFSCMIQQVIATVISQIQSRHIHTNCQTWRERHARCRQYNGISLNRYANTSFNRLGRDGNAVFVTLAAWMSCLAIRISSLASTLRLLASCRLVASPIYLYVSHTIIHFCNTSA